MLDNASGSATIPDIAKMMKNVTPLNNLRFIWFGREDQGLLGSAYTSTSSPPPRPVISATTSMVM